MKPIQGYDLINEAGNFKRLPAGIYGVKITSVKDNVANQYLEITCDIVKGEYKDYFASMVANGLPDNSRTIRSYKENALPFFKAFITAVEKTNPPYKWDWDEKKLVGKIVIAVFGEEEYLDKDGNVKVGTKIVEFRSKEAWKEGKIQVPPLKKLVVQEKEEQKDNSSLEFPDFPSVEEKPLEEVVAELPDDDLPF